MNPVPGYDVLRAVVPEGVADWLEGPEGADPRVSGWFLLDSPWGPIGISCFYLLSIPVGNWLMEGRKPLNVTTFATVHNAFLASLSLYMVVETLSASYTNFRWGDRFTLWCNLLDRRGIEDGRWTESAHRLASVIYVHYVSKAYEFVDTWLMIAKKKKNQQTFLHIYHHATVFFPTWYWNTLFAPGGDAYFCCFLNSLVHVFMYSHYLIANLGYRSPIRRFITTFQLIQFVLFIGQSAVLLTTDCFTPRMPGVQLGYQCVIFFCLFMNFYIKAYTKPRRGADAGADRGSQKPALDSADPKLNKNKNKNENGTKPKSN